jgi:hypothetical protein
LYTTDNLQIGIDWTVDMGDVRRRLGHDVAVQGNMDPTLLFASQVRACCYVLPHCSISAANCAAGVFVFD